MTETTCTHPYTETIENCWTEERNDDGLNCYQCEQCKQLVEIESTCDVHSELLNTTPIDETEPQKKTYQPTSMGEILEFAESLGWSEPEGYPHHDRGWEPDDADGLEQAALDHIEDAGYEIMEPNE